MAVEGLACGVLNPIMATVTYETVPEGLRSRVLSATTASVQLVTPLGGLTAGFLVDSVGLPATLLTVGGVYLLATLCPVIFPAWRQMDSTGSLHDRTRQDRGRTAAGFEGETDVETRAACAWAVFRLRTTAWSCRAAATIDNTERYVSSTKLRAVRAT